MTAKQGAKGNVVGRETRERRRRQTMRVLQLIVKDCVFHPKRCEKICIPLPPLPSPSMHTKEGIEGGLKQYF